MPFALGRAIFVMGVVAAITGGAIALRGSGGRADLQIWVFADSHQRIFQPLIHKYQASSGQTIALQLVKSQAMRIRLQQAFLTHQPEVLPDLVEVEIGAMGTFFRPPLEDVGFLDLTDRIKASGWYERIVRNRFGPWTKQGRIFGVPHDVHPVTLCYREDLFREAGIDLAACDTWPSLHAACIRFRDYWRRAGYPVRHAIELPRANADALVMMLLQRGVNLIDEQNRIHLNDPIVAATLAFYVQMVAGAGDVASDSGGAAGSLTRDVQEGNLCAFLTPDWRVSELRRYAVNQDDPSKDISGRLRMMPLPRFDPGDCPTSTWGGTMMGISRACKDPDRAWKLLEYLYLSRDALRARQAMSHILPPVPEFWSDPIYQQPDAFFGGQRVDALYVQLASSVPARIVTPASAVAISTLAYVQNRAIESLESDGPEGLEARCQTWLDAAAADLERRIRHWSFTSERP